MVNAAGSQVQPLPPMAMAPGMQSTEVPAQSNSLTMQPAAMPSLPGATADGPMPMAIGMPEGGAQAMLGAESTKTSSRSIGSILKNVLGMGGMGAALGFVAQLLPLPFVGGAGIMAIAAGGAIGATLGLVKAMRGGKSEDQPAAGAMPEGPEVPVTQQPAKAPAPAPPATPPTKGANKSKTGHKVKRGDTLSTIAKRHNVDWRKLYEANKETIGANPNLIRPGMELRLPH